MKRFIGLLVALCVVVVTDRPSAVAQQAHGPRLISAVSRKAHNTPGGPASFDVPLTLGAGAEAVEGRYRDFDLNCDLTLVLTFDVPVSAADGVLDASEFTLTGGVYAEAAFTGGIPAGAASTGAGAAGTELTLQVSVPSDPVCVQVTLAGLVDTATGALPLAGDADFGVVVLEGDVDGNGRLDDADVALIACQYGQAVTAANFRADTDTDGVITAEWDAELTRAFAECWTLSRTGCPPDADRDGVNDSQDNCPLHANPDQTDTDADGTGDACTPRAVLTEPQAQARGESEPQAQARGVRPEPQARGPITADPGAAVKSPGLKRTPAPEKVRSTPGIGLPEKSGAVVTPRMPIRRPFLHARPFTMAELSATLIQPAADTGATGVLKGQPPKAAAPDATSAQTGAEPIEATATFTPDGGFLISAATAGGECPYTIPQFDFVHFDGAVDQEDYGFVQSCYTGANTPPATEDCWYADLDADNDVDQDDLAFFEHCASGPALPADPRCGDCNCNGILDTYEIRWCMDCGSDIDLDDDLIPDFCDNCPAIPNGLNLHVCDECPEPSLCDGCPGPEPCVDCPKPYVCKASAHPEWANQVDEDGDGVGDMCDNCLDWPNPDQADTDGDGVGNACAGDLDGDDILDAVDNCPEIANANAQETDCNLNGVIDAGEGIGQQCDSDQDGQGDACDDDDDADGIGDAADNCPVTPNAGQEDGDEDGIGDACDTCQVAPDADQKDQEGDRIGDLCDNCPAVWNQDQANSDTDSLGDACDVCPLHADVNQEDTDCNQNGVADPGEAAGQQCDIDQDSQGDACDDDDDGDGVLDGVDNCPLTANASQQDLDEDDVGDICEIGFVDLDVDSDNDNGTDPPDRSWAEDTIEDDQGRLGKILIVNEDDDDDDGIPDMDADGVNPAEDDLFPLIIGIRPGRHLVPKDVIQYYVNAGGLRIWRSAQRGIIATDTIGGGVQTYVVRIRGDLDASGAIDGNDLTAFDQGVQDFATFKITYWNTGISDADVRATGDLDGDDVLDAEDRVLLQDLIANPRTDYIPVRLWIEALTRTPHDQTELITIYADTDANGQFESDVVRLFSFSLEICNQYGGLPAGEACAINAWIPGGCYGMGYWGAAWNNNHDHSSLLNVDTRIGFGPVDLPPRKTNPWLSSSPLVSGEVRHFAGSAPHRERAMLNDVLDIVTGLPLLQEIDFELPFGSAVFRHVRTYSENVACHSLNLNPRNPQGTKHNLLDTDTHWDWNGSHWMMSESPVFLIDAAYEWNLGEPKRCYFIPDSHHAIPFTYDDSISRQQGKPVYIAPAWFDALLDNDGEVNSEGVLTRRPTEFYLWLHRKSIKYTIRAIYEDVPDWMHDPADHVTIRWYAWVTEQRGAAHYGTVSRIQDRYGNSVEYHYCDVEQSDCDYWTATRCHTCCMTCNQKGQLKAIQLRSSSGEVMWTLFYTHRAFGEPLEGVAGPVDPQGYPPTDDLWHPHMLHSIHVYEGAVAIPDGCLTIGSDAFRNARTLDEIDALVHSEIPANWKYEARYLYDEPLYWAEMCPGATAYRSGATANMDSHDGWGYRLLKTTFTRRVSSDSVVSSQSEFRMYRYGNTGSFYTPLDDDNANIGLTEVYGKDTVAGILDATCSGSGDRMPRACEEGRLEHVVNELLATPGTTLVACRNNGGSVVKKPLQELADMSFVEAHDGWSFGYTDLNRYLIDSIGGDPVKTSYVNDGKTGFMDRRATPAGQAFRIRRYMKLPNSYPREWDPYTGGALTAGMDARVWGETSSPSLWHFPYRFLKVLPPTAPYEFETFPHDYILHATVIDELGCDDDVPGSCIGEVFAPGNDHFQEALKSRRIVEMNAAGFVIRDRTYRFGPGGPELLAASGFTEDVIYDDKGRVRQRRSDGWNTLSEQDQLTNGAIVVYGYEDDPNPEDPDDWDAIAKGQWGELKFVGIKKGSSASGDIYYLESYEHGHKDIGRPELVTATVRYPEPATVLSAPGAYRIEHSFELGTSQSGMAIDRPIVAKKTIHRPGSPIIAGGPDCYLVEQVEMDEDGNEEWLGAGILSDLENPSAGPYFFVQYDQYSGYGRLEQSIFDTEQVSPRGMARAVPNPAENEALHYPTTHFYHLVLGRIKTIFPNEREEHTVYPSLGPSMEQWVYRDVVPGQPFQIFSPVEITRLDNGRLAEIRKVKLTATDNLPNANEPYEVLSSTVPEFNEAGRVVGVKGTGATGGTAGAGISYDGGGNVNRQQSPDGTVTRQVYDELGRLQRVYRGTRDIHTFWATADPEQPDLFSDDLVLIEKRYYGHGETDAGKLTQVRQYRDGPLNQYYEQPVDGDPDPPPLNNENNIGRVTNYYYDWRMREVWVEHLNATGDAVSHSLTWLDNLDRPVLVAEYGAHDRDDIRGAIVAPDEMEPDSTRPTAEALFTASSTIQPLSVTENTYDARGQVEEVRVYRYDADITPPLQYTATRTYYDHAGRPTEVYSPGSPVQKYEYDAKGRQIFSRTLAADVEVSKTQTKYDADDRAVESIHWERKPDATGDTLTDDNSVKTYTHSWYDPAGKLLATADYGTNSEADTYTSGAVGPTRGDEPPAIGTAGVLVTKYEYDNAGNQNAVFHPDGTLTRSEYDGLNRLILTIENAGGPDDQQRITAYFYECADDPSPGCNSARLLKMAAVLPDHNGGVTQWSQINWLATDGTLQVTEFTYDAHVVGNPVADPQGVVSLPDISAHNGWISAVHYPDPDTGQPSATADLTFTYYSDGSVASRTDRKGNQFIYQHDELGRLFETLITAGQAAYADGFTPTHTPPTPIAQILYTHTPAGRLESVTALDQTGGNVLAENKFAYDERGNLTEERQSHAGAVNGSTPFVEYAWDYDPCVDDEDLFSFDRLQTVTYPARPEGGTPRALTFGYGAAGSVDHALSRVTAIQDAQIGLAAGYGYMGVSRRVSTTYGNGVTQSFAGGAGCTGLDRYGRVIDLHFTHPAITTPPEHTIHRYQYGYDQAGNRTHARTTQAPIGATPHDNDRSYRYTYDGLQRLLTSHLGKLDATNEAIVHDAAVPRERFTGWSLDSLGNWTGNSLEGGLLIGDYFDGSSTPQPQEFSHTVNSANQIEAISEFGDGPSEPLLYDRAGNMVLASHMYKDEFTILRVHRYVYQYDAWNRLIQVNEAGTLVYESPESTTDDFNADGQIAPAPGSGHAIGTLLMRMTYDGLGRLIRVEKPLAGSVPPEPVCQAEDYYYDGVRRIQEVVTQPDVQGQDPPQVWTEREFIYSPDYVDEFVAQIDDPAETGAPPYGAPQVMFILQDANFNVVGILSAPVNPQTTAPDVLAQYTYEPYGALAISEEPGLSESTPKGNANTIGHQGLFAYRLTTGESTLHPDTLILYYNRNRWYDPQHGRFTSRDPNETAMPILSTMAMNATVAAILLESFNPGGHFADGMSLYGYQRANPVRGLDPMGLYDPFEAVDDWNSERVGNALYTVGMLNDRATLALTVALDVAKSLLPGYGLYEAFGSVQAIGAGRGGFWDAVNIATAALPIARLGSKLLGMRSLMKTRRYRLQHCNCFVAGTDVATPTGDAPIESLAKGDEVVTRHQDHPDEPVRHGCVTRVFRSLAPAILWLTLANGQVMGITPEHEVWTHQDGWTAAAGLEIGDTFMDREGAPIAIIDLAFDQIQTFVYNLEIDGTFTYFAEGVWVHNNSCLGLVNAARRLVKHHTIPDAALKELKRLNSKVHAQVMARAKGGKNSLLFNIPEDMHKSVHGAVGVPGYGLPGGQFNTAWLNEIDAAGGAVNITADKIFQIRERLLADFDLWQYAPK